MKANDAKRALRRPFLRELFRDNGSSRKSPT